MPEKYTVECSECDANFTMHYSPEKRSGCTVDCPTCGALLYCNEDGSTTEFNKMLNEKEPSWPRDGKGTGSVEIDGKGVRFYDG